MLVYPAVGTLAVVVLAVLSIVLDAVACWKRWHRVAFLTTCASPALGLALILLAAWLAVAALLLEGGK
jgi:hypothetical protein